MQFKGNAAVEDLSDFLKARHDHYAVTVATAFFDETLAARLGEDADRSVCERIHDAQDSRLLTLNEHDDFRTLRQLRNDFAHDLRVKAFDTEADATVDSLKLWRTASSVLPLRQGVTTTLDTLVDVVGVIAFRLQRRTKRTPKPGPLPEPPVTYVRAWPPLTTN